MAKMRAMSPTWPSSIGVSPRGSSPSSVIVICVIIDANRDGGIRPQVRSVMVFAPVALTTASTRLDSISRKPKMSGIVVIAANSAGDGSNPMSAKDDRQTSTTGVRR